MSWVFSESKRSLISSFIPPSPPPQPEVFHGFLHQNQLNPSPYNFQKEQSTSKISPAVLFIIVILAVVFFISGLLHLLVRFLLRPQSPSPREPELSDSANTFQGQLQQLFNLHDSGVDQAFIDALPVFIYKAIMGSETEPPFDCAVCLCEFGSEDKLRLLPNCSHAFHLDCIDTWLLSHSTCPLCRGSISSDFHGVFIPSFGDEIGVSRERENGLEEVVAGGDSGGDQGFQKQVEIGVERESEQRVEREEIVDVPEQRVFPVKLGKFRSLNNNGALERESGNSSGVLERESGSSSGVLERESGSSGSCSMDARRCYSMGSFQYVLGTNDLRVAVTPAKKMRIPANLESRNCDLEAKKLSNAGKFESFSVSKIWQWSKKDKCSSSEERIGGLFKL
ncbi:hypothetical protein AMTRI_Chr10g230920 [Amborella trichopoda]|uniref:RING-type E3 ubiquitin transferase n=1 Tax=Amborella trichopoda TaxID=13333 RepID=W1NXT8_AMBTC|nr:RING-H2 finger protein ATL47 [Amborella trichopoda]ERM99504.1 hypothetical protein AMTR_s00088p00040490 [Amborella trichopoda]|eukprot:XP_006836651.1 RING-H2 finger protein ATL47 [Amborella trichopoda]